MAQPARWTEKAANEWYAKQPWLVGSNYLPATAINQLEMWQADTFDPVWIDTELNWAEDLGMNTMRVFLHDLLWKQDSGASSAASTNSCSIADTHKIRPIFVLFDSCWDPFPQINDQRPPKPGVHNSGWVQSPGAAALRDPAQTDAPAAICAGRDWGVSLRQARAGLGLVERAGQHQRFVLQEAWSRRTRWSWCWRCCPRSSSGRAPCCRSSR